MAQLQSKFIANNAVTNAKLAQSPANTLKGNNTGSSANASDLTVSQVQALLSIPTSSSPLALASGGTGVSAGSANAAFNALSPMTTAGDLIFENATPTAARLPIGTTGQILTVVSGLPSWQSASPTGVTSVALSDSSTSPIYNISGSPVTSTGTLAFTLKTQSANTVFAGPGTGAAAQPTFRALVAADVPNLSATYVTQSEVGAPSGVASLDSGGHIPLSQLPASIVEYKGTWNASTNTPTLANGTGTSGWFYIVSTAGSTDFGAGPIAFNAGDWVLYNGTIWERAVQSNIVQSVNGATGVVTVNAINQLTGDITAGPASGSASASSALVATSNATLTTLSALTTASSLASVGTITSGSWAASTIAIAHGGTGQTNAASAFNALAPLTSTGDLIYEVSAGSAGRLAIGLSNQVLTVIGGVPAWTTLAATSVDGTTIKYNGSTQLEAIQPHEQQFTLASGDITNQYVDLAFVAFGASASNNSVGVYVVGGPEQQKTVDYTVSLTGGVSGVTRISFAGDLATGGAAALVAGDILVIDYSYLA